jgi:hypothetical protein
MATKMILPPLSEWTTNAGGTGAAEGKYGHGITRDGVQWSIQPVSRQWGRHIGYTLWAFGLPKESGYVWFDTKGEKNYVAHGLHRSPQSAAKIAREVHQRVFGAIAWSKGLGGPHR